MMNKRHENAPLIVDMQDVSKTFFTTEVETRALWQVSLAIRRGEYVSISGPSGSGKTTFLSILGLLDTPTSGSYRLNAREVGRLGAGERARIRNREIGFIFQTFNLIGDLTVAENVELPLIYRGLPVAERRSRVDAALDSVQMSDRKKHFPFQLSGGQQQRVSVARAVAGGPSILFADEPTGSLDSKNGDVVMDLLDALNAAGSTLCVVTHNEEYARRASRQVNIHDGSIVTGALAACAE
jgi:putative ABC transport system ATP-binding protein